MIEDGVVGKADGETLGNRLLRENDTVGTVAAQKLCLHFGGSKADDFFCAQLRE